MKNSHNKTRYLVLPSIIFVAIMTQIPFLMTIILSFMRWNIKRPDIPRTFAGLSNYTRVFSDSDFYKVLINTLLMTAVSLVLCVILAFFLAMFFTRTFKGVYIARSLIIVPYFVTESVVGIVWKTLFLSPTFGFNKYIADIFGTEPIDFLGQKSLIAIMILIIWQWTPFLFMILLAGFQNISEPVVESARIDGASGFNMLRYIIVPMLRGYIEIAAMFGLINILKVFGLVFVTTQGGPGVSSANLPYYVYRTAFYDWQIGRASAIAVVMVAITLIIIQSFIGVMRRSTKKEA